MGCPGSDGVVPVILQPAWLWGKKCVGKIIILGDIYSASSVIEDIYEYFVFVSYEAISYPWIDTRAMDSYDIPGTWYDGMKNAFFHTVPSRVSPEYQSAYQVSYSII